MINKNKQTKSFFVPFQPILLIFQFHPGSPCSRWASPVRRHHIQMSRNNQLTTLPVSPAPLTHLTDCWLHTLQLRQSRDGCMDRAAYACSPNNLLHIKEVMWDLSSALGENVLWCCSCLRWSSMTSMTWGSNSVFTFNKLITPQHVWSEFYD